MDNGVSICITAYKSEKYIKECLDSVVSQTWFKNHDDWEILLGIDNCAATLHYIQPIMSQYKNLRVFMMDSNRGTYVTTNTIMKQAKYDGLIRFDSDDIMLPNMVEDIMKHKGDFDLVYFKMENFDNERTRGINPTCGQVYIRKEIFDKFGGYRPYVCSADLDLGIRLKDFAKIKRIDKVLLKRRIHSTNLTVAKATCYTSAKRRAINNEINSRKYNKESDAIIECVTNTFIEIFSDTEISQYSVEQQVKDDKEKFIKNNLPKTEKLKKYREARKIRNRKGTLKEKHVTYKRPI